MILIEITSLSGHSPYDITICDITNSYCYSGATGVVSVPTSVTIPDELSGVTEFLVVVTDSIGCSEIQYHSCPVLTPTPTPTVTPTITPTNALCNCISIENPSGITLNFGYTQCDGTLFYGDIYSATTLFVCGSAPYGDSGLTINISSDICVGNVCPGPTATPTPTPTVTPTLPSVVGYFEDSCDASNQFTLSDIPSSFSPLSGVYYIESDGFIGCATSVISSSTSNVYSFIAMGSQPSIFYCQNSNFIYPCPTLTPTPSITPSITPTVTVTPTQTLTPTSTITPTPTLTYSVFEVINCCTKKIKFISLPSHFLIGSSIVASDGYCYQLNAKTSVPVTEYWNNGTTYVDCSTCIKYVTCSPSSPPAFISVWQTTTSSESLFLPYIPTGSYSGTIDWGDGTTSINSYANRTHTYATAGTYTISITGTVTGISFYDGTPLGYSNALKINSVSQWGCLRLGNSGSNFSFCLNLTLNTVSDSLILTGTTSINALFGNCQSITTINNINSWDTSTITSMSEVFLNCYLFDDDISNWNVSNVTDFSYMFSVATLFNQPIGVWNVSGATNMNFMFSESYAFDQDLSSWDVSNVTIMTAMFLQATIFNNNGSSFISGWTTSNVNTMSGMFGGSSFNQPINSWDVSNVTNMSSMFVFNSAFNQNIGSWDVSNVSNFTDFMLGKTNLDYSTTNLNSIYNGWSTLPTLQSSININFGTIKYTAGGSAGKAILTGPPNNWTITDGGI
jgi:surface protein